MHRVCRAAGGRTARQPRLPNSMSCLQVKSAAARCPPKLCAVRPAAPPSAASPAARGLRACPCRHEQRACACARPQAARPWMGLRRPVPRAPAPAYLPSRVPSPWMGWGQTHSSGPTWGLPCRGAGAGCASAGAVGGTSGGAVGVTQFVAVHASWGLRARARNGVHARGYTLWGAHYGVQRCRRCLWGSEHASL